MPKFLGIDYGLERLGLAVSDPEGRLAFPLATLGLKQCGSRAALLDELCGRAREASVEKMVFGLPLFADGSDNLACRQVRNFAARMRRRLPLPVYFMPELLSSEEASLDLRQAGLKHSRRKAVLDQQAACRILSSFLALSDTEREKYENSA